MADGSLSVKRSITVRAVVTPRWKEDAEREISAAIANSDAQLGQLEQEGQQLVDAIRSQSANPLDPRVQEQVGSVQEQVAAKRAELEEPSKSPLRRSLPLSRVKSASIERQTSVGHPRNLHARPLLHHDGGQDRGMAQEAR